MTTDELTDRLGKNKTMMRFWFIIVSLIGIFLLVSCFAILGSLQILYKKMVEIENAHKVYVQQSEQKNTDIHTQTKSVKK